jgi:branched-chain amino acid transport system ATP-binding protein
VRGAILLEVDKINAAYGDIQVLWDISFRVHEGKVFALIGSNGAGKTTILRTISGLIRPRSGTIKLCGEPIGKLPSHRIVERGIAHIPEGRQLFARMTVLENLELGAFTCTSKEEINENLQWVFELFPRLEERRKQLAGTLSGGEQQMLAIGRGLMMKPKLLMIDEPSLGLQPTLVLKVFEIVKKLKEEGMTILLVEQDSRHALEACDYAYVLETGHIVLEGTGKSLLKNEDVKKAYLGL